ncbi:MAG TPA: ABC transporter ATP-binding protein [Chloroflexaceae bacterium]|nr:ABC transporter ATP-binding protein [Chloroflexaceae bacterium]
MTQPDIPVIETRGLAKSFGAVQALRGVDLQVPRRTICGFLGPNGAGKTTLIKLLLGLSRPTAGQATIFGRDIVAESVAIRERVGYLPQQPRFIDYMSARENLHFAARFSFRGPPATLRARCDEMLALVGLEGRADRPISGFSGGERQRLGIALAQVHQPDLLILDEPASALDPLGRQAVLAIMERLRERTTIFFSTHILDDVQRVSDTVAILSAGRIVASGPIARLLGGQGDTAYTVTVRGAPAGLRERLALLPWVTRAEETRRDGLSTWHVGVRDERAAEAELLRHVLADGEVTVTEFGRRRYELEDVFVALVKEGSHGR